MLHADPIELVTDAAPSLGYRLTAVWGASRWLTGSPRHGFATACAEAYSPNGETIWSVAGEALVALDRAGRRVAPSHPLPDALWVTLARGGRHAAYTRAGRALVVLELPSMREVYRLEHAASYPAISADGRVVAADTAVYRVGDPARCDTLEGLCSLSPDGSLALAALAVDSPSRAFEVRLHRVGAGGAPRRRARAVTAFDANVAWSGDGAYVAWSSAEGLTIWDTREPSTPRGFSRERPLGAMHFVPTSEGPRLLVAYASSLELRAPDGDRVRCVRGERVAVGAVTADGSRALCNTGRTRRELDLATGEFLTGADDAVALADVTRVAWDPSRPAALVLRQDGDLRVWDVARWCTERAIDADRTLVARTPPPASPTLPYVERVAAAFAPDGARIVLVDADATVTALTRDGSRVWSRRLEPDPAWGPDWRWYSARLSVDARVVRAAMVWTHFDGYESYANPVWSERGITTTLDAGDGRVLAHEDAASPSYPSGSPARPRFTTVRGARDAVLIDGEPLAFDPALGAPTSVHPSPDERALLVATSAGLLLRFERV